MYAHIRIEQGGNVVGRIRVASRKVIIGRAPDVDVQIADQRLSRHHCQVELANGRVILTDLGSSNGTFYKNQRIQQAVLGPGDFFFIGRTRLLVDEIAEPSAEAVTDPNAQSRAVIGFAGGAGSPSGAVPGLQQTIDGAASPASPIPALQAPLAAATPVAGMPAMAAGPGLGGAVVSVGSGPLDYGPTGRVQTYDEAMAAAAAAGGPGGYSPAGGVPAAGANAPTQGPGFELRFEGRGPGGPGGMPGPGPQGPATPPAPMAPPGLPPLPPLPVPAGAGAPGVRPGGLPPLPTPGMPAGARPGPGMPPLPAPSPALAPVPAAAAGGARPTPAAPVASPGVRPGAPPPSALPAAAAPAPAGGRGPAPRAPQPAPGGRPGSTGFTETSSGGPAPVQGYQIFDRLGEGSMGVVYTAQRTDTGELCVLKLIEFTGSAKDAIFFIREAQAGSRIKHPNVVETMDFGESNGFLYLAMEFIEGGSLLDRIKRGGPLTNREALDQLRQVADALAFAFKKKIVHRDIKPANILLTKDGRPKLADFGLAKTMQAAGSKGLTQMGEARGTPIYMPPEQLTTAADADQRSDIYSLGATYYHALSGHHPFRAPTVPEILRMVVTQPPVPIRDRNPTAHPAICATIERMMRKDPNDRYQTPEELAAALEPLVNVVT